MKRVLASLTAFSLILIAANGCSKDNGSAKKPGPASEKQQGDDWQLKLTANCQGAVAEQCVGAYGFTVFSDGHFEAGPAPETAQVHKGKVSAETLKNIKDVLAAAKYKESCNDMLMLVGDEANDTLTLKEQGKNQAVVTSSNGQANACTADPSQAEALHKAIRELAKANYPLPFPSECVAAIDALEALYPAIQQCQRNEDCEYADISYNPIPAGQKAFVAVQDCSRINPIVAANKALLVDNQAKLLQARDHARKVCGPELARPQCTSIRGLQADRTPAICREGSCQAASTADLNLY
jgi:hypothetical protein